MCSGMYRHDRTETRTPDRCGTRVRLPPSPPRSPPIGRLLHWAGNSFAGGIMPLPLPRPCVVCQRLTNPGRSRCPEHLAEASSQKRQRRQSAQGDGARQRLRRSLNREGMGVCARCGLETLSEFLQVDHRVALADGGTDFDSNVWALCIGCHSLKTAREATDRSKP